ncbi:MAG: GatB/YqeY domain-containing protein [Candidatus Eisenbacteria bacterium]|nr:GatB/YqeY domain-containing protein [Candidatus Eisenbacteria bacterium]
MTILDRLERDMKEAARARDSARLGAIRFARSELGNRRIEVGRELDESDVTDVLSRIAKRHRESIEQFAGAGRDDLVDRERAQLEVIEEYLPEKLTREELLSIIGEAIEETGASSMRDMGAVMKVVMPRVMGRAEGGEVKSLVQSRLGAGE